MHSSASKNDFQTWLVQTLTRTVDTRKVFGAALFVRHADRFYGAAAGDLGLDTPFFIASVTKLFTTTLVLQLRQADQLALDSPITTLLDAETLRGLHTLHGHDHTAQITVQHLLAHTSGLPDYFEGSDHQGQRWDQRLMTDEDFGWTPAEAIARSKTMPPAFAPGTSGKALYADTNFQLLGLIIERLLGQPLARCFAERITQPLELKHTYLYTAPTDHTPHDIWLHDQRLHRPRAMASFGADGGIVSTAQELLTFVDAFFSGALFDRTVLSELQHFNPIFYPLQAGVGLQRLQLPWLLDPLRRLPPLLGHCGLSGSMAWHDPMHDISIAGTINQIAQPGLGIRLALRVARRLIHAQA